MLPQLAVTNRFDIGSNWNFKWYFNSENIDGSWSILLFRLLSSCDCQEYCFYKRNTIYRWTYCFYVCEPRDSVGYYLWISSSYVDFVDCGGNLDFCIISLFSVDCRGRLFVVLILLLLEVVYTRIFIRKFSNYWPEVSSFQFNYTLNRYSLLFLLSDSRHHQLRVHPHQQQLQQ